MAAFHKLTGENPGFAVHKFNRLVARGLHSAGLEVRAFSPFMPRYAEQPAEEIGYEDGGFVIIHPEGSRAAGLRRHWGSLSGIAALTLEAASAMRSRGVRPVIVADVLAMSACIGALWAAGRARIPTCGIVTDLPQLIVPEGKLSAADRIFRSLAPRYIRMFDSYVLLTEQMGKVVNPHKRPQMVMEGIVDPESTVLETTAGKETSIKRIIYAGGIDAAFGLRELMQGVSSLHRPDLRLEIYGSGPMVDEIREYSRHHPGVVYGGVVENSQIVKMEREAWLLVNPRLSDKEYTAFSFPSKNMEYMASGTPLLTTRLPGMPEEYLQYVHTVERETPEGFAAAIEKILSLSPDRHSALGEAARRFVTTRKDFRTQGRRIAEFINSQLLH